MKKNIIIVAVILVLALFASINAMSGDGGNVPEQNEKGTESVQVQSEQVQQAVKEVQEEPAVVSVQEEKSDEKVTVKDQLGIDTGMTEKEFEEFKTDFIKKAKEIGLPEGRDGFNSYFKLKINLNVYEELKNNGV